MITFKNQYGIRIEISGAGGDLSALTNSSFKQQMNKIKYIIQV